MLRKLTMIALCASSLAIASEGKITVSLSAKTLDAAETTKIKPALEFLAGPILSAAMTTTKFTGTYLVPAAALSVSSGIITTPMLAAIATPGIAAIATPVAPFVVGGCFTYAVYNKLFTSKKA